MDVLLVGRCLWASGCTAITTPCASPRGSNHSASLKRFKTLAPSALSFSRITDFDVVEPLAYCHWDVFHQAQCRRCRLVRFAAIQQIFHSLSSSLSPQGHRLSQHCSCRQQSDHVRLGLGGVRRTGKEQACFFTPSARSLSTPAEGINSIDVPAERFQQDEADGQGNSPQGEPSTKSSDNYSSESDDSYGNSRFNVVIDRFVPIPDEFRGNLIGARTRHLKEMRYRTGAKYIGYNDERKEVHVRGTPTIVAAAVDALQARLTFLQNARQLRTALYPHASKHYVLLDEAFSPKDSIQFVTSFTPPCLGGAAPCELMPVEASHEDPAFEQQVRLPRELCADSSVKTSRAEKHFWDISAKKDFIQEFASFVKVLQAHQSPAPYDQVKLLFVLGMQQFYPLAAYHPPLAGGTISFERLERLQIKEPDKTLRSDFSTVLTQDMVKQAAAHFRQVSTADVEVVRARGIDLYLNDHKLAVGVRIRFDLPVDTPWREEPLHLTPQSIKTTNGRPFTITFLRPAGTLDFRIELSARYELRSENLENIRELWRMARRCIWDPARPSEVRMPKDSISRFSVRRIKNWDDATLVGRIPWKLPNSSPHVGTAKGNQSELSPDCEIHLQVTKACDRGELVYSIVGSSPQLNTSQGPVTVKEHHVETIVEFCTGMCKAIELEPSSRRDSGSVSEDDARLDARERRR